MFRVVFVTTSEIELRQKLLCLSFISDVTTTTALGIKIQSSSRGSAVERQSLASVLSPSCARPVADG